MSSQRPSFRRSLNPEIRELQDWLSRLVVNDSPTVTWSSGPNGLTATITTRSVPQRPQLNTIVINGRRLTISGTPARYIQFALDGSSASWSSSEVSPWPADGSVGYIDTNGDYSTEAVLLP